ncbi:MAG: hypothetical protein FD135_3602 [Comamonadaceae bacterium]|nr:MAG: hypothetical protein FD135_3602 [Comamonadaceae bacterium]
MSSEAKACHLKLVAKTRPQSEPLIDIGFDHQQRLFLNCLDQRRLGETTDFELLSLMNAVYKIGKMADVHRIMDYLESRGRLTIRKESIRWVAQITKSGIDFLEGCEGSMGVAS